jgi:hypothetical protein
VHAGRHGETPEALLMIKSVLRGCPAVIGYSRVDVSDTCRSPRPEDLPAPPPARHRRCPSGTEPIASRIDGVRHLHDISPGNEPRLSRQPLLHA